MSITRSIPKKRGIPPFLVENQQERSPKKVKHGTAAYIDLTDDAGCIDSWNSNSGASPRVGPEAYDTCFGLLCMNATSNLSSHAVFHCTPAALRFEGNIIFIDFASTYETGIAVLVSETLSRLAQQFKVSLTATVCGKKTKSPFDTGPRLLPVRIIVYGFNQQKNAIADALAQGDMYLQHPGETEFDGNVEYVNPQYLLGPGQKMPPIEELSVSTCCATHGPQRSVQTRDVLDESEVNQVQRIFDTAAESDGGMPMMEPSSRLITQPKRHQMEALVMMVEKEEGIYEKAHFPAIWKASQDSNGQLGYQNIVTELFEMCPPPPLGGGILADDMGLGKTLSSLALICHHLDQIDKTPHSSQSSRRTTLVVTPKSTIYGWEKQITNHIHWRMIRWTTYYGSNRQVSARGLGQYDIVLTTYETLRSEEVSKGPLFANEWARVILDEAHRIRNRNSKLFRAVGALSSQRRWCLTGTPIQNSLEDFGALLSFVRTPYLDTRDLFGHYISRPVKEKQRNSLELLRKVVAATCLRRTKNSHSLELNLPRKTERVEFVKMSPGDREIYEFFKRFSYLMAEGDKSLQTKPTTNILVLISILRLICDHGEALLTDAARKAWEKRDDNLLTWRMLEANIKQCISCHSDVEEGALGVSAIEELVCGHLLCDGCVTRSQSTDSQPSCPECAENQVQTLSFKSQSSSQGGPGQPTKPRLSPSAKLQAILHNISQPQSPTGVNEQFGKAVIFSYWTKMLDLIANALDERGISFQRIDGQSSMRQRTEALERFGKDSHCKIMLASIGAAGEGIDLTAATAVHIVEPHWNPMAESQAIDRVHRIGQTRDVEVVRYVVEDSIEVYVRWVQSHKLQMIKESLSSSEQNLQVSEVRWKKLLEFLE